MIVYLNNGEKLQLERPSRGANMATLAKQISECGLVSAVDTGGLTDENERYEDGRCIGFVADL